MRNNDRYYEIPDLEGVKFPSSTTIISQLAKPALIQWAAKEAAEYIRREVIDRLTSGEMLIDQLKEMDITLLMKEAKAHHEKVKEEKADLGSLMHKIIHQHFASIDSVVDVPPELQAAYAGFRDWEGQYFITPIECEMKVWHTVFRYAGTLDLVCWYKADDSDRPAEQIVVDFKTGKGVLYPEMKMQLASYKAAYEQRHQVNLAGGGILLLNRDTGEPAWHFLSNDLLDLELRKFLCLAELWHLTHLEEGQKKNGDKE